jgi:NADPH-dependent 2,4-dienoyl-CoA reductase/sulfur reductase-like enzyme
MRGGEQIVIVGAGLAGLRAAERLRELGFEGSLVIVGDEPRAPYNRTPLSKGLLTGDVEPTDLRFRVFTELEAIWRTHTQATALDVARRVVRLRGTEEVPFDGLVIATGVEARHLPGAPLHLPGVRMLRTLDDCRAIDAALSRAAHVAIVGGGFIGCEMASTARERALGVTLIDVSDTLLTHALGPKLGAVVETLQQANGVRLHLGTAVTGWSGHRDRVRLELKDGERIDADAVVVGIGTAANTDWLRDSGLEVSDGVLCEATCHVAGAEDVVAAGDVARWPNLRYDDVPRRVEHWINAVEHGRAAAESLLAGRAAARPYCPLPRFWSEQHGVKIQSVGRPLGEVTIAEGSIHDNRFVATYTQAGRLMGMVAFDSPRRVSHFSHVLEAEHPAPALSSAA